MISFANFMAWAHSLLALTSHGQTWGGLQMMSYGWEKVLIVTLL